MRYIKTLRIQKGWTLEFVAKHAGITKSAYCHIELGHRGASTEIWDALEDMFGIDQRVLRAVTEEKDEEEDHLWDYQSRKWEPFGVSL